jgi:hypothetical protein
MFEYDVKFPLESQLTIKIYDKSRIGTRTEIGCTEIDLENRFYSKCYATCGLPKSFDITGQNPWRDVYSPRQILNRMCKVYKLNPPVYDENNVLSIKSPEKILPFKYGNEETKLAENYNKLTSFIRIKENDYLRENFALDALNDWERITKVSCFQSNRKKKR